MCGLPDCDEDGAPACAPHYECNPSAAAAPALLLAGSALADSADPVVEAARGCVRKHCNQPDGFTCKERWSCAPDEASDEASGCVPDPCTETGLCSDDGAFICEPSNDGPRPPYKDPQGCATRNCGEGIECRYLVESNNYGYCALESPESDELGCRVRQCDEASVVCLDGFGCDPGSDRANEMGCRPLHCNETGARACPAGTVCGPANTESENHSCLPAPVSVPLGGAGGASSGGAPSTGGSGRGAAPSGGFATGGGASATGGSGNRGGIPAELATPGVCVAR